VRLGRVRGLLAPDAKIDAAFGAARSLLEDAPHPFEEARVELAWGERLVLAGRAADAVPHLEHALTGFDALGATGWSARARRALAGATGTSVPTRAVRTDVLSAQELRVARHAAGGARDREIAALLYLSPRTVEAYLQSSYRKLGVGNRTQLAALLASEGITPLEVS
jgi:DNA-binding CsgD family transcriptional regulator